MDGLGRFLDNIIVERQWRRIKYEEVYLKAYQNGSEARKGIDAYLYFYNQKRPTRFWTIGFRVRCMSRKGQTWVYQTRQQPYPRV